MFFEFSFFIDILSYVFVNNQKIVPWSYYKGYKDVIKI